MTNRETLFGQRITKLRREVAELKMDIMVLASLTTYSPAMDCYDLRATVRDLGGATEAARTILMKLEQINRS
jgi:hypothetical protein